MSATFRELFDEEERDELLSAVNARKSALESRWKKSQQTITATTSRTEERLRKSLNRLENIIDTLLEESN